MGQDALAKTLSDKKKARIERNPLRKWINENYQALEQAHYRQGLTYQEMAETAAQLGVRNINGDLPKSHVTRKWFVVEEARWKALRQGKYRKRK